jgi:hypothetical protein
MEERPVKRNKWRRYGIVSDEIRLSENAESGRSHEHQNGTKNPSCALSFFLAVVTPHVVKRFIKAGSLRSQGRHDDHLVGRRMRHAL